MHVRRKRNLWAGVQRGFAHHASAHNYTDQDSYTHAYSHCDAHTYVNANPHTHAHADSDCNAGRRRRTERRWANDGRLSTEPGG